MSKPSSENHAEAARPVLDQPRPSQSPAQRSKAYRERRSAEGRHAVKCYLTPEQKAYLSALCEIHQVSIAEALGLALTRMIRGESSLL